MSQVYVYFVGLVVASTTVEHDVPGSIPGSGKVSLGFSVSKFTAAIYEMIMKNIVRKHIINIAYQRNSVLQTKVNKNIGINHL